MNLWFYKGFVHLSFCVLMDEAFLLAFVVKNFSAENIYSFQAIYVLLRPSPNPPLS